MMTPKIAISRLEEVNAMPLTPPRSRARMAGGSRQEAVP